MDEALREYRDHYYRSKDGLQLYARDYPCRTAQQSRPEVVLCMHGLTRNSADFAGIASHLSERYRVLSVDCRGRGKSAYDTETGNYTPATYVKDMFALLDGLAIDKVILCGTSMGGLMAFMMGASQPQRVRGVIINDIGPEIDPRGLARIKSYVGKSGPVANWDEALAQTKAINAIAFEDFSEQAWLEFTRGLYRECDGVPVLAYDPAISKPIADDEKTAVPQDLWPLFDVLLHTPMLVVRGASSDILAPSCVATMRARKPDLGYAEIPRRGHAPTLTEPAAVTAIDHFLQSLS